MLIPAAPSLLAALPRAPGLSARTIWMMSSSDVSQLPAARAFFGHRRFINDQSNRILAVRNRCHEANDVHLLRAQSVGDSTQHPRPVFDPYAKPLRFWHGVSSIKNCD